MWSLHQLQHVFIFVHSPSSGLPSKRGEFPGRQWKPASMSIQNSKFIGMPLSKISRLDKIVGWSHYNVPHSNWNTTKVWPGSTATQLYRILIVLMLDDFRSLWGRINHQMMKCNSNYPLSIWLSHYDNTVIETVFSLIRLYITPGATEMNWNHVTGK